MSRADPGVDAEQVRRAFGWASVRSQRCVRRRRAGQKRAGRESLRRRISNCANQRLFLYSWLEVRSRSQATKIGEGRWNKINDAQRSSAHVDENEKK
jgi:hypothetical protein